VKVGGLVFEQDEYKLFHCHIAGCNFTCSSVPQLRSHPHVRAAWKKTPNTAASPAAAEIMEIDEPSGE
jgi:hypothetical protein